MKRNLIKTLAGSALISLGVLGAGTMAAQAEKHANDDMAEVQAFQSATQTLDQAIKAAETQLGGKAMSAEFETEGKDVPMFEVEVLLPDGTTQTAIVNAMDGTVTVMADDAEDRNGEGDDGDNDDDGDGEDDNKTGN